MVRRGLIFLALAATVALPFVFRPHQRTLAKADDTLVIISPHNEAIRHEFTLGFREWYHQHTGRTVFVDWRVIGGTSDIARFLDSTYLAAFQYYWTRSLGRAWNATVEGAFDDPRLPANAPELAQEARRAFLASDVSSGLDLFFGGGSFDFIQQARAGRLVPSQVVRTHPEWFNDGVYPLTHAGDDYRDPQGRWFGDVLSSFGLLYNRDAIRRLGMPPPRQWQDLTDPRLLGELGLSDPTKSGSMAKAFENIIQQQMQLRLRALRSTAEGESPAAVEERAVREGWAAGLRLIRLMGANAAYFTDDAQKPPIDVSQGDAAVGVCIDFYGRFQAESTRRRDRSDRLVYVTPAGGSEFSVDPIGLLRGAPHRQVAEAFIAYVLSMDGQKLWNFKPGAPGGPEEFALRRLPVRKDFYAHADWRQYRSDPDEDPYAIADPLIYHPAWTGHLFREMAFCIRVMCLDTHPELVDAWRAVIKAGFPPQAMAALNDVSLLNYAQASGPIKRALESSNQVEAVRLANELGAKLRVQYRRAAELAREGR